MKLTSLPGIARSTRTAAPCRDPHHCHEPSDRVSLGERPGGSRLRLTCGDIAQLRASQPQQQMGATALSLSGAGTALQMSASMTEGGHAAVCLKCNFSYYCILEPAHTGQHACSQGHSWH